MGLAKKLVIIAIHMLIVFAMMDLLLVALSETSVPSLTTDLSIAMYEYADEDTQQAVRQSLLMQCEQPDTLSEVETIYCTDEGRLQLEEACANINLYPADMQTQLSTACDQVQSADPDELCETIRQSTETLSDPKLMSSCQDVLEDRLDFSTYFGMYMKHTVTQTMESGLEFAGVNEALSFLESPWFTPSPFMIFFKLSVITILIVLLFMVTTLHDAMKHLIRIFRSTGVLLVFVYVLLYVVLMYATPDTTGLFLGEEPTTQTLFWLVIIVLQAITTIYVFYAGVILLVFWLLLRIYVHIIAKQEELLQFQ